MSKRFEITGLGSKIKYERLYRQGLDPGLSPGMWISHWESTLLLLQGGKWKISSHPTRKLPFTLSLFILSPLTHGDRYYFQIYLIHSSISSKITDNLFIDWTTHTSSFHGMLWMRKATAAEEHENVPISVTLWSQTR